MKEICSGRGGSAGAGKDKVMWKKTKKMTNRRIIVYNMKQHMNRCKTIYERWRDEQDNKYPKSIQRL